MEKINRFKIAVLRKWHAKFEGHQNQGTQDQGADEPCFNQRMSVCIYTYKYINIYSVKKNKYA